MIVVCKLPKAGLGNQLFPLMHAFVFAKLNNLPVIVTGYHQLKIGPYIRREKSKRRYKGYFTFQKNIIGEYRDRLKIKKLEKKYHCVYEPAVKTITGKDLEGTVFIFEKMTTYHDYFVHLRDHRQAVIDILDSIVSPEIKEWVRRSSAPQVGIHIRMGDFRKLDEGEVYKGGHVRIPEEYFVDTINTIRKINGTDLEATVFTDGHRHEFTKLFDLKNIRLAEPKPDIADLLLLSKSGVIVTSSGSTFSIWAAFLSSAPVITYFDLPAPIRAEHEYFCEGVFDKKNEALISQVKNISN